MAKHPLHIKLYFDKAYIEIARMIGYAGIESKSAGEHAEKLAKQFKRNRQLGTTDPIEIRKRLQEACNEIATFDEKTKTYHLTDEAKALCHQLLGYPPGHENYKEKTGKGR